MQFHFRNPVRFMQKMMALTKLRLLYFLLFLLAIFIINYFGLLKHLFEVDYSKFSYPLDIPVRDVLNTLKKGENPPYQPINEYKFPFLIDNSKKCVELNGNYENVVILYVIKSALTHKNRRDRIRKTWGLENRFPDVNIKRIFMLGISSDLILQKQIVKESAENNDIVQAEFIDSYYNNTVKTMLGFQWVVKNCRKAQFIMFSDDDMYVSTKNLLKFISNPFNKLVGFRKRRDLINILQSLKRTVDSDLVLSAFDGRLLAGYVFSSSPMRHKSSKWYISLSEYPYSMYPPYVTAGAYVLSYPALEDLHYTSMYTKHFKFDDVYLGILAKKCGISPFHNQNFYFWKKEYSKDGYANVIASHGYGNPDELKTIWEEQKILGYA